MEPRPQSGPHPGAQPHGSASQGPQSHASGPGGHTRPTGTQPARPNTSHQGPTTAHVDTQAPEGASQSYWPTPRGPQHPIPKTQVPGNKVTDSQNSNINQKTDNQKSNSDQKTESQRSNTNQETDNQNSGRIQDMTLLRTLSPAPTRLPTPQHRQPDKGHRRGPRRFWRWGGTRQRTSATSGGHRVAPTGHRSAAVTNPPALPPIYLPAHPAAARPHPRGAATGVQQRGPTWGLQLRHRGGDRRRYTDANIEETCCEGPASRPRAQTSCPGLEPRPRAQLHATSPSTSRKTSHGPPARMHYPSREWGSGCGVVQGGADRQVTGSPNADREVSHLPPARMHYPSRDWGSGRGVVGGDTDRQSGTAQKRKYGLKMVCREERRKDELQEILRVTVQRTHTARPVAEVRVRRPSSRR